MTYVAVDLSGGQRRPVPIRGCGTRCQIFHRAPRLRTLLIRGAVTDQSRATPNILTISLPKTASTMAVPTIGNSRKYASPINGELSRTRNAVAALMSGVEAGVGMPIACVT